MSHKNKGKGKEKVAEDSSPQSFKEQGNKCFELGDFKQAIQWYTKGIEEDPTNHILYSNRSAAYLILKGVDQAIEDAKKCIEIAGEQFPKGYIRLADAFILKGEFDEAISVYNKCLSFSQSVAGLNQICEIGKLNAEVKKFYEPTIKLQNYGLEVK
eukprot:TRINITY_DN2367_c0_g2_i3.p2 TRINITY_DN2367_c0_g2~~TRINITY_DN2367_c0_g2_i3.p2  ORF type:complete len:156 (-),score=39.82 TRINITY_DN2367_c0_g2_i3:661-1128(-)